MEVCEVRLWQQLGYKAQEVTPVSHTMLAENPEYASCYDLLSCEVCNKADEEEIMLQCDTCHRLYHTHCMRLPTAPAGRTRGVELHTLRSAGCQYCQPTL